MIKRLFSWLGGANGKKSAKGKPPVFRVYEPDEHGIHDEDIPDSALEVVDTLQGAGFQAFLVGGSVRDMLLGAHPKDFDVATDARPEQVKRLFRRAYIIGRRFRIVHVHIGHDLIEVTTFRGPTDGDAHTDEHGRILSDNTFGSHIEDACRRDFTINALYYDAHDGSVWDAHQGLEDLRKRQLQTIGKSDVRFREDPVRMLRMLRFAAKLDFKLEESAEKSIHKNAHLLGGVPPARLGDEISKFLLNGYAQKGLNILNDWGLLHAYIAFVPSAEEAESQAADIADKAHHKKNPKEPHRIKPHRVHITPFAQLALQKTDERHRQDKKRSFAFIMAALLWPAVVEESDRLRQSGLKDIIALQEAMDTVLHKQLQKVSLTRATSVEIRDLWRFQQSLIQPRVRNIYHHAGHPRLTAAIDFLELRDEAARINAEGIKRDGLHAQDINNPQIAQTGEGENFFLHERDVGYWARWWRSFLISDDRERQRMIGVWEEYFEAHRQQNRLPKTTTRKRPRRRKPKGNTADSGEGLPPAPLGHGGE